VRFQLLKIWFPEPALALAKGRQRLHLPATAPSHSLTGIPASSSEPDQVNKINYEGKSCQRIRSLESTEKFVTETAQKAAQSKTTVSVQ